MDSVRDCTRTRECPGESDSDRPVQIRYHINIPLYPGVIDTDFSHGKCLQQIAGALIATQLQQARKMRAAKCNRITALSAIHRHRNLRSVFDSIDQRGDRRRLHIRHIGESDHPAGRFWRKRQCMHERCRHAFSGSRTDRHFAAKRTQWQSDSVRAGTHYHQHVRQCRQQIFCRSAGYDIAICQRLQQFVFRTCRIETRAFSCCKQDTDEWNCRFRRRAQGGTVPRCSRSLRHSHSRPAGRAPFRPGSRVPW